MQINGNSNNPFGSGKVAASSNNGSSSGGSVFSGVAKQTSGHWGQPKKIDKND